MKGSIMKKFFAGVTKGISATQIKATDLISINITKDTNASDVLQAMASAKIDDLVTNALSESRATYAITSQFPVVKEAIANQLQAQFMSRVREIIEAGTDDMDVVEDLMDNGKISKDVFEYVVDMVSALKAEEEAEVAPVEPVVIDKGINLTNDQVLSMMAARGLTIGGFVKAAMGEGTVLGFKVGQAGTMVVMSVNGQQLTVMASKVEGNTQTKNVEENVQMTTNNNVNVGTAPSLVFVAPVNEEAQAVVESAVVNNEETPWNELTAEERAAAEELKLQADLIRFQEAQENKSATASANANSAAAQVLKAMGGGAVKSPAANTAAPSPAAPAAAAPQLSGAPVANGRPAAQAPARQSNQNQTNGGNVQMTNNNVQTQGAAVSQGRQGSAAPAFGGQAVGRQGSTPSLALNGGAVVSSNPALAGWAGINAAMDLIQVDEYVGNRSNNRSLVWYLDEVSKYAEVMTLAELKAAGFKNEAMGITNIKFYTAAAVAGLWGREAAENDFMYAEVFFGQTSYEFRIKRGTTNPNREGQVNPYIFSSNIVRKQDAYTGLWACEYVAGRREDTLKVVVQADGVVREARTVWNAQTRTRDIHAEDAPFVQEVGGKNWVNQASYGTKVGQAVFIQVMIVMDELSGLKAARDAK